MRFLLILIHVGVSITAPTSDPSAKNGMKSISHEKRQIGDISFQNYESREPLVIWANIPESLRNQDTILQNQQRQDKSRSFFHDQVNPSKLNVQIIEDYFPNVNLPEWLYAQPEPSINIQEPPLINQILPGSIVPTVSSFHQANYQNDNLESAGFVLPSVNVNSFAEFSKLFDSEDSLGGVMTLEFSSSSTSNTTPQTSLIVDSKKLDPPIISPTRINNVHQARNLFQGTDTPRQNEDLSLRKKVSQSSSPGYSIEKVPEIASFSKSGFFSESDIPDISEIQNIFEKKTAKIEATPAIKSRTQFDQPKDVGVTYLTSTHLQPQKASQYPMSKLLDELSFKIPTQMVLPLEQKRYMFNPSRPINALTMPGIASFSKTGFFPETDIPQISEIQNTFGQSPAKIEAIAADIKSRTQINQPVDAVEISYFPPTYLQTQKASQDLSFKSPNDFKIPTKMVLPFEQKKHAFKPNKPIIAESVPEVASFNTGNNLAKIVVLPADIKSRTQLEKPEDVVGSTIPLQKQTGSRDQSFKSSDELASGIPTKMVLPFEQKKYVFNSHKPIIAESVPAIASFARGEHSANIAVVPANIESRTQLNQPEEVVSTTQSLRQTGSQDQSIKLSAELPSRIYTKMVLPFEEKRYVFNSKNTIIAESVPEIASFTKAEHSANIVVVPGNIKSRIKVIQPEDVGSTTQLPRQTSSRDQSFRISDELSSRIPIKMVLPFEQKKYVFNSNKPIIDKSVPEIASHNKVNILTNIVEVPTDIKSITQLDQPEFVGSTTQLQIHTGSQDQSFKSSDDLASRIPTKMALPYEQKNYVFNESASITADNVPEFVTSSLSQAEPTFTDSATVEISNQKESINAEDNIDKLEINGDQETENIFEYHTQHDVANAKTLAENKNIDFEEIRSEINEEKKVENVSEYFTEKVYQNSTEKTVPPVEETNNNAFNSSKSNAEDVPDVANFSKTNTSSNVELISNMATKIIGVPLEKKHIDSEDKFNESQLHEEKATEKVSEIITKEVYQDSSENFLQTEKSGLVDSSDYQHSINPATTILPFDGPILGDKLSHTTPTNIVEQSTTFVFDYSKSNVDNVLDVDDFSKTSTPRVELTLNDADIFKAPNEIRKDTLNESKLNGEKIADYVSESNPIHELSDTTPTKRVEEPLDEKTYVFDYSKSDADHILDIVHFTRTSISPHVEHTFNDGIVKVPEESVDIKDKFNFQLNGEKKTDHVSESNTEKTDEYPSETSLQTENSSLVDSESVYPSDNEDSINFATTTLSFEASIQSDELSDTTPTTRVEERLDERTFVFDYSKSNTDHILDVVHFTRTSISPHVEHTFDDGIFEVPEESVDVKDKSNFQLNGEKKADYVSESNTEKTDEYPSETFLQTENSSLVDSASVYPSDNEDSIDFATTTLSSKAPIQSDELSDTTPTTRVEERLDEKAFVFNYSKSNTDHILDVADFSKISISPYIELSTFKTGFEMPDASIHVKNRFNESQLNEEKKTESITESPFGDLETETYLQTEKSSLVESESIFPSESNDLATTFLSIQGDELSHRITTESYVPSVAHFNTSASSHVEPTLNGSTKIPDEIVAGDMLNEIRLNGESKIDFNLPEFITEKTTEDLSETQKTEKAILGFESDQPSDNEDLNSTILLSDGSLQGVELSTTIPTRMLQPKEVELYVSDPIKVENVSKVASDVNVEASFEKQTNEPQQHKLENDSISFTEKLSGDTSESDLQTEKPTLVKSDSFYPYDDEQFSDFAKTISSLDGTIGNEELTTQIPSMVDLLTKENPTESDAENVEAEFIKIISHSNAELTSTEAVNIEVLTRKESADAEDEFQFYEDKETKNDFESFTRNAYEDTPEINSQTVESNLLAPLKSSDNITETPTPFNETQSEENSIAFSTSSTNNDNDLADISLRNQVVEEVINGETENSFDTSTDSDGGVTEIVVKSDYLLIKDLDLDLDNAENEKVPHASGVNSVIKTTIDEDQTEDYGVTAAK